jgi:glutathione synthase/RimK-type ligase-like ATP-grasp enzyme
MEGILRVGEQLIELGLVTAVYMRPYALEQLPALQPFDPRGVEWRQARAVVEALSSWTEMTPALVVNRFSAMASNASKPYQAGRFESHGFAIPETLITTDGEAVREFWLRHGTIIYKSISSVRSIVARLTTEHLDRLALLRWCPTQFQQYIPGTDYRVHVVGDEVFACEIESSADDYRYAGRSGTTVSIRDSPLEDDVAERCRSLVRGLRLSVAGVDLRYHPARRWFCFEVNPSPAFTYYQAATGQPIDEAIADLLIRGACPSDPSAS